MKLYTSYYAQLKNFPKSLIALSTAVFPPKWINFGTNNKDITVLNCKPLVPGRECEYLCRGKCDPPHPYDCEFLKTYRKQLDKINFDEFYGYMKELSKRYNDADFAFIVFEPPTRECSERRIIQQWIQDNGFDIEEWRK